VTDALPSAATSGRGRAQDLARMPGEVNAIYVAADGASAVPAVRDQIARLLPDATVTTSESVAETVSGSLKTATRLVGRGGPRLLAGLVLFAAFALACQLTLSAVSRRSRELGLLKALGWRSRQVVGQVTAEALAQGTAGALVGVALGIAAAGLISRLAPPLSATAGLPGTSSVDLLARTRITCCRIRSSPAAPCPAWISLPRSPPT
jgi:putative ABC transport system permease protein